MRNLLLLFVCLILPYGASSGADPFNDNDSRRCLFHLRSSDLSDRDDLDELGKCLAGSDESDWGLCFQDDDAFSGCMDYSCGNTWYMLLCMGTEARRERKKFDFEYARAMKTLPEEKRASLEQAQKDREAYRNGYCDFGNHRYSGSLGRVNASLCRLMEISGSAEELAGIVKRRSDYRTHPARADIVSETAQKKEKISLEDKRLNFEYKRAMKALPEWRRDGLQWIQRSWISYRDSSCAFLHYDDSGAWGELAISGCKLGMTSERADELADIAEEEEEMRESSDVDNDPYYTESFD